jgi:hypothetical protein
MNYRMAFTQEGMTMRLITTIGLLLFCGCGSGSNDPMLDAAAKSEHAPKPPPQAIQVDAGPDQTVHVGDAVQLTGSATAKGNNVQWHFTSVPAGSTAQLVNADTLTPTFVPDLAGRYVVALAMNASQSDQVTVDAQANLVTLHFNGALRTDVVISGTFTYETTIGPNATNVRNLSPNVLYRLTAWNFVVESALTGLLPSTTYRNDEPGNTAEFCEGVCIFSPNSFLQLSFGNTGATVLTLLFEVRDPTPFINPPSGLAEWGVMVESTYRIPCPICAPLAVINTGTLTL